MKMNYRQNNKKKKNIIFSLALVFLVIFLYVYIDRITYALSNMTHRVVIPVFKVSNTASSFFSSFTSFFISNENLKKEITLLEEKINEMKIKSLLSEYLVAENIRLKNMLNRSSHKEKDIVLGVVVSKPNKSVYDTLIIDVGNNYGIQKGDKVIAYGDVVIGFIEDVYDLSAKVILYSHGKEVNSAIIGIDNIPVEVIGRGGGNFEAKLPRDANVVVGDIVSIPDIDIKILGTVEYIQKEANDPFQVVFIKSPVNIYELKFVEIVKKLNYYTQDQNDE